MIYILEQKYCFREQVLRSDERKIELLWQWYTFLNKNIVLGNKYYGVMKEKLSSLWQWYTFLNKNIALGNKYYGVMKEKLSSCDNDKHSWTKILL